MDGRGEGLAGSLPAQGLLRLNERAGRVDDVVQDQDVSPLDVADDVQDLASRSFRCAACR